jgi:hypothetical protein
MNHYLFFDISAKRFSTRQFVLLCAVLTSTVFIWKILWILESCLILEVIFPIYCGICFDKLPMATIPQGEKKTKLAKIVKKLIAIYKSKDSIFI